MRTLRGINNQHQIERSVNFFAENNDEKYPESVATLQSVRHWNWTDPRMMICEKPRKGQYHRSMSAYLHGYVEDASIMYCPNAPRKYKYLQRAWDAGEEWDNPDTAMDTDSLSGTYCFYWNYIGYLKERNRPFKGPRTTLDGRRRSKLLMSCYFGYDHHRSSNAYGSCERFKDSGIAFGKDLSSAYWFCDNNADLDKIGIKLHAVYTDGHVGSYSASDVVTMKVSKNPDGTIPYEDWLGLGDFYLPRNNLR